MKIKELVEQVQSITPLYFTGSIAFGVGTVKSDYDYVLDIVKFRPVVNVLNKLNIKYVDDSINYVSIEDFISLKLNMEDGVVNLIFGGADKVNRWKVGTSELIKMINESSTFKYYMSNKDNRVHIFETFVNQVLVECKI